MITYIETQDFGRIRITKRRGSRTMRIAVSQTGEVRLSIPYRLSTEEGLRFLNEKKSWVNKHKTDQTYLEDGARIGLSHTLRIVASTNTKTTSKVTDNEIIVKMPEEAMLDEVQKKLEQIAKKILKNEADFLLPQKLIIYAQQANYRVKSVAIKPLQSRWGSCSSVGDIVLNSYLMQLPWSLIEYVMYHELAHTVHHNHSDNFWEELQKHVPDYKIRRRVLKKYPTKVFDMRESERFVS